jgi:hypothetical protein
MQGPDFILIGQQRAGTRWLYDQLRSSDRFWMPPIKEISYFKGSIFKKAELHQLLEMTRGGDCADLSEADLACLRHLEHLPNNRAITSGDYLRIFSFKGDRISGDITPKYEKIPKKKIIDVWNLVPDAKLVYLIRVPVQRRGDGKNPHGRDVCASHVANLNLEELVVDIFGTEHGILVLRRYPGKTRHGSRPDRVLPRRQGLCIRLARGLQPERGRQEIATGT